MQTTGMASADCDAARVDIGVVDEAMTTLCGKLKVFLLQKMIEAGEPILASKGAGDWTSGSVSDAPSEYMQKVVMDLLAPAVCCFLWI